MQEFHAVNARLELADDVAEYYQEVHGTLSGFIPSFGPFLRATMRPLEALLEAQDIDPLQWNIMRVLSAHGNHANQDWYYVNRKEDAHRHQVQGWINRYDGKVPILVIAVCNPLRGKAGEYVTPSANHSLLVYPVGETPILRMFSAADAQTEGLRFALPKNCTHSVRAAFEYAVAYKKMQER